MSTVPPGSVDLGPIFQKWGLSTRSQGARGTCSVFTLVGAMEYALAQKQHHATRLSVEFLNWAKNQSLPPSNDGGKFSDLWQGFETYGDCLEEDLPYRENFDPGLKPSDQALYHARIIRDMGLRLSWIKTWDPMCGLTDSQFLTIKDVLNHQWPVCSGFLWPKHNQARWKDGVLQKVPREDVMDGHSVLLVGYRDDPGQPGGGVFIFHNTQNGGHTAAMSYEYARTYMNDAVWIDASKGGVASAPSLPDVLGLLGGRPAGRNRRVSSNQQPGWHNENLDMNWLMPGDSVNMPILEGPGVITHLWMTSHSGWLGELNALTLRIYYDDAKEPGVEVPLGDFFVVGQGRPAVVESVPVQVSPTGALTCYWRMPFRKNARIVVTNDNPDRSTGLYWQVDYVQLDDLPPDTPYFYARYRQEYPAVSGRDYLIADLSGSGYYVGTVMSVTMAQGGWFGEGDDFFYIDGEEVPSLQGTGTEDYFNDAWGFRPRTSHWFGQPRWQGDQPGDSGICYRWHVLDPVHFRKSLKVAIEHRGNLEEDTAGFFLERPDFFSSVAYWYQTGQPKTTFPPLPPWPERCVPWQRHYLVKTFLKAQVKGGSKVKVETQGFFGARPMLAWIHPQPGEVLSLPFDAAEEGRYAVRLTAAAGPAGGIYDISIDGKKGSRVDFHAAGEDELDLPLGVYDLAKGNHTLAFHAAKPGPSGTLGLEILRLLKLPPEAKRKEKTHHEAHFVRLGIGRAVYAYRLAFDKLPDSLETLVKEGFMPKRYLKDENHLPLKSWREGDALVVESPGKDHWKYSWRGLDARR